MSAGPPLLRRVAARKGRALTIHFDGAPVGAFEGESVLAALLAHGARLRRFEFGPGDRAGFCLMGACQDCLVWLDDGSSLRACGVVAREGMRLSSRPPGAEDHA